jgi:hypothetical protein
MQTLSYILNSSCTTRCVRHTYTSLSYTCVNTCAHRSLAVPCCPQVVPKGYCGLACSRTSSATMHSSSGRCLFRYSSSPCSYPQHRHNPTFHLLPKQLVPRLHRPTILPCETHFPSTIDSLCAADERQTPSFSRRSVVRIISRSL